MLRDEVINTTSDLSMNTPDAVLLYLVHAASRTGPVVFTVVRTSCHVSTYSFVSSKLGCLQRTTRNISTALIAGHCAHS